MYLTEAVDQIRDTLVQHRLSGRKTLWATILKQIAKQDSFDGHHAETILDAIRAFLKPVDDKTILSLWRETETGMCDDTEDECLFPDCCRMDLEMEILQQTTDNRTGLVGGRAVEAEVEKKEVASSRNGGRLMIPIHQDPHFIFRFADDRIIPRFHLEGIEAKRHICVFKIDSNTGERLGLLATSTVGEDGWVDLRQPIIVQAGEAFIAVPE